MGRPGRPGTFGKPGNLGKPEPGGVGGAAFAAATRAATTKRV